MNSLFYYTIGLQINLLWREDGNLTMMMAA
jgi:hypothetical protein